MAIKLDEARIRLLNISGGIVPTANNSLNLGNSNYKWANIYATTFHGALDGNASTATKLGTSTIGSSVKPIYLNSGTATACSYELGANIKAYSGSLSSGGWETLNGKSNSPSIAIAYNNSAASWNSGKYSASLVFGCSNTRGLLDCSHNSPIVTFGGCSYGGSSNDAPTWYMKLSGTNGKTYTLPTDSKTLCASDGTNASGTWGINIIGKATKDSDGNPINTTYVKKSGSEMSNLNALTAAVSTTTNIVPNEDAIASSPFAKSFWHDHFAFLSGGHVISNHQVTTNGTTWTNSTLDITPLFMQKESTLITILGKTELARRFVMEGPNVPCSMISWYEIGVGYSETFSHFEICIEASTDKSSWSQIHKSTITRTIVPFFLRGSDLGNNRYLRFTFTKITNTTTGIVSISCLKAYTRRKADQGLGIEHEYPYDWNASRDIYPHNDNVRSLGLSNRRWKNIYATTFTGALSGNASTATKLATARTIELTGSVTGSASFDGNNNISISTTTNHTHSYLPLSGGTLNSGTAQIQRAGSSTSWINGRNNAMIKINSCSGYNAIYSMKTTNGDWSCGVHSDDTLYWTYCTDTDFNASNNAITARMYITSAGTLYTSKVYGAVWNDYAEYRESNEQIKPGRVVIENGDDTLSLSSERLQAGANIVSDTYGFAIGETSKAQTPIAVSGRVLAYPYEPRDSFSAGDAVCSGPNGTVSKMTRDEIIMYPERIIGTVSAIPDYEVWGTGNIDVDGRIWIRIK